MMTFLFVVLGFLLGVGVTALVFTDSEGKRKRKEGTEKEKIDINLQDIVSLAALSTTADVNALMIGYKIHIKIPEFYEKYQALNKQEKELYFNELIEIFSRNKREYVRDLWDRYAGFTNQDVLLLLMCEMHLDNKTMARIMGLTVDTLKKRKTRLKAKMHLNKPILPPSVKVD